MTVTATPTTTGTVTATPTTSSTLTASPDNSCNEALNIEPTSALNPGDSTTPYYGINVGSSQAWFTVTIGSTVSSFTLTLTGAAFNNAPAGSDVMNVGTDCAGTEVASDVTSYTGTAPGQYWIVVTEGSSGADGGFELTATAS